MAKKSKITEDDKNLFRQATAGAKPLSISKISPVILPPKPRVKKAKIDDDSPQTFEFSDFEKIDPVSSADAIQFACPGLQHKMLRKLRQGQYNVEAKLDLHGRTVEEARIILSDFLTYCEQQHMKHVLIIHGRGLNNKQPILKNKLNHWLRQTPLVLAFCSALPRDGHTGAVYVLLRS